MDAKPLTFGSLFAGIGGFDLALTRCGMRGLYAAELNPKCNSVRRRHWPDETQYTDVAFVGRGSRPDVVCAGWPCQGNSVAGRRAGMADERSGLWREVVRVLTEQRPRWFLGENVPGLLSVGGGIDYATVLGDLAELGYGFAYRVLDAQWFGVPQRRRRIIIVGCLGDWRRAAEILFESDSLPWDSPPRRETWEGTSACLTSGAHPGGHNGQDDFKDGRLIPMAFAQNQRDEVRMMEVTGALAAEPGMKQQTYVYQCHGSNVGEMGTVRAGNGGLTGGVPFTIHGTDTNGKVASPDEVSQCIRTRAPGSTENSSTTVVAYRTSGNCGVMEQGDRTAALNCQSDPCEHIIQNQFGVRRLMPIECERLQGFPDDWTRYGADDEEMADSVRYRMCGNAVAVPCIEWIGRRLMESQ